MRCCLCYLRGVPWLAARCWARCGVYAGCANDAGRAGYADYLGRAIGVAVCGRCSEVSVTVQPVYQKPRTRKLLGKYQSSLSSANQACGEYETATRPICETREHQSAIPTSICNPGRQKTGDRCQGFAADGDVPVRPATLFLNPRFFSSHFLARENALGAVVSAADSGFGSLVAEDYNGRFKPRCPQRWPLWQAPGMQRAERRGRATSLQSRRGGGAK